ncbi:MspA family porin [Nocardia sp. 2YAB30]|uniref:MspA family porin n=1 Tax=Nocardia sp. 2YAB30 TaxID=3233022 RepID=UPI003F97E1D5
MAAAAMGVCAAGIARADTSPDKSRTVTTEDGWDLRITTTAANLDRVPNLAATPFTREGFVSLTATADVSGSGQQAVDAGSLTLGYQIGCQVDVSTGAALGVSGLIGPNVGITVAPTPGLNVGGSALVVPSISVNPKPGAITALPFGTKTLAGPHGSISVDQVQIKVDACLGAVSLRSYAIVSMSTATADNSVAVYGDPIWL